MIVQERIFDEVNSIVKTTLGLSSDSIITKAVKFARFDWRALLEYFETIAAGLEPPYVIIRTGPVESLDWGMACDVRQIPIEIFYIESLRNKIDTNVDGNVVASDTVIVDSTDGMFVGQRLYFVGADVYGIIETVDSATQITLESVITLTDGEQIISDLSSDIEVKMEQLKNAFSRGSSYTNFQIMEDPETDVSDMNPVNEYSGGDNFQILAGSCYILPLVGVIL